MKTVWLLAWPAVALNGLQTVNSLLDSNFVQHLEADALTAIGSALTSLFLLISMSMAMGVAATALVSRAFGAGDEEGYREANRKCLGFAVGVSILLTVLALVFSPILAENLVPPGRPRSATLMHQYLAIASLVLPGSFVIQTLAGSLRGIGDTKSPMYVSGIQILLHIGLNFLLIFPSRAIGGFFVPGAGLGLAGAAWAMVISASVSALAYLVWCTRTPLGEVWRIKFPDMGWVRRIFSLAAPAGLMSVVRVTSLMAFTWILTNVPKGEVAIGAIRPGFSIEALAFMPSFGLAVAASALVGQSLGMKDPDRASRLGWMAAHMAAIISLVVSIFMFVFADQLAGLLLSEKAEFASMTADYLRHVATTEVMFGYGMVLISAQQGAGDTRSPFWITLICMWFIRVPLAAFLAVRSLDFGLIVVRGGLGLGANGCWLALAITQAIQGMAAIVVWQQGHWKRAKV